MAGLRIALTLSGAVSLGAYEGGVLAGLLRALEGIRVQEPEAIRIDVIAGASAGSMTGVLAARALLTQDDPVSLMHSAWVETPSLEALRGHGPGAPLTIEHVTANAQALLTGKCARPMAENPPPAQKTRVRLRLALGALRGLEYSFRRLGAPPLEATSYLDWYDATLGPESTGDEYLAVLTPALASGAHAAAFSAQMLHRADLRQEYVDNGVTNFPGSGCLWYTDGGTIDNQPLGSALDVAAEVDDDLGEDRRLHLLVIPDPSFGSPSADLSWADPNDSPDWIWTLPQAAKMAVAQSLYDDMRTAEKVNSRLRWVDDLVKLVAPRVTPADCEALAALISQLDGQRSRDLGANESDLPPAPGATEGATELLTRAIHAATGLHGKSAVAIDAISPRLLGDNDEAELDHQLAGEFLHHFGGFLAIEARQSDFALGYRSALAWLADPTRGLAFNGVPSDLADLAVATAKRSMPAAPAGAGDLDLARLGPRVWAELMELTSRAARLAESGLRSRTGHGSAPADEQSPSQGSQDDR